MNKRCIVNAAICNEGSWYKKGQMRLSSSLDAVGEKAIKLFIHHEKPMLRSPYEDKVWAIKTAGSATPYRHLLWLDCSITAIRPLDEIWAHIEKHGYYLYQSGGNCAQTCNDNALETYGFTRDEAEKITEVASNVVGINLDHPVGMQFFNDWTGSLMGNANIGIKWPKNEKEKNSESLDPRFKYHRQDQSTASLSAGRQNLKLEKEGHFVLRHENISRLSDSVIFILKGGE